jgi:hypothetical protein
MHLKILATLTLATIAGSGTSASACVDSKSFQSGNQIGWQIQNNCRDVLRFRYCMSFGNGLAGYRVGNGYVNPGTRSKVGPTIPPGGSLEDSDIQSCLGEYCSPSAPNCVY